MRIAPRNWVLGGVFAVLLAFSLREPGSSAGLGQREITRLFPDFRAEDAAYVVMEGSPSPSDTDPASTEATKVRIELRRRAAEGEAEPWILPAHFDHPANTVSVEQLFNALSSLTNLDLLSEDPGRHGDYGVGDSGLTVRVLDASDELIAGFVQGANASTGAGMASYIRSLGGDGVYRAPRVGPIPLQPRYWLERRWTSFKPVRVRKLEIRKGTEVAEWSRSDMERWDSDDRPVSARRVRDFLERLALLFLDEAVAAEVDGRSADLVISIEMVDGTRETLSFARPNDEGEREAWLNGEGRVVRFAASTSASLDGWIRELEERK